jgi:amino acid transporter
LKKKIGFWEAYSIGVGGMIGGGIFAVLGLTILLAKGAAPIAFLFAGIIALLTSYSYAKLSVRYPSEGGTVEFLVRAFGNNLLTGYLNLLLLSSYIIMLSLYSYAFGSYASAVFFGHEILLLKKLLIAGVIIFFTLLNFLGAYISGKAEDIMVFTKVGILLFFSILGFFTGDFSRLSPEHWESLFNILTGGLIIFLAYEGFELIANTAQDVENPEKVLPKAFYAAVISVIFIYVLVSMVAVANLTYEEVKKYSDYALAVAAKPFLHELGFILIGIAAMLSTASAINATLYGSARVSYLVAKFGALPKDLTKKVWKNGTEGLLIIGIITIIFATTFNLENISVAGSLGFLIIFSAVNLANFKLAEYTNSNKWISFIAFLMCILSIIVLISYNLKNSPNSLKSFIIVLLGTIIFETAYRKLSKRKIQPYIDWRLKEIEEFIKNQEEHIPKIIEYLKDRFKTAEIYIEGSVNHLKEKTHPHLVFTIITDTIIEEVKKEEELLKKALNLGEHIPIRLKFKKSKDKKD